MLVFTLGLVYGLLTMCSFLYVVLLGLGCYFGTHGALPEEDTADAVIWFVGSLGVVRVGAYILLALLWPILLLSILALWLLFKKPESRDEVPEKWLQRFDWFFLGFGKFVQAK